MRKKIWGVDIFVEFSLACRFVSCSMLHGEATKRTLYALALCNASHESLAACHVHSGTSRPRQQLWRKKSLLFFLTLSQARFRIYCSLVFAHYCLPKFAWSIEKYCAFGNLEFAKKFDD